MNTFLIKTVSDLEILIGDLKARLVPENDFKKKLRGLAQDIVNDAMAEDIDRDLEAGKVVFGHKKNPETGKVEPVEKEKSPEEKVREYQSWGFMKLAKAFGLPKDYAEKYNPFKKEPNWEYTTDWLPPR